MKESWIGDQIRLRLEGEPSAEGELSVQGELSAGGNVSNEIDKLLFGFHVVPSTLNWAGGGGHSSR
jgi:hypothetical protein